MTAGENAAYRVALGQRIRYARNERGLSLRDVEIATGSDIKATVLGSWERAERRCSAEQLAGVADFFDVDGGWLLGAGAEATS